MSGSPQKSAQTHKRKVWKTHHLTIPRKGGSQDVLGILSTGNSPVKRSSVTETQKKRKQTCSSSLSYVAAVPTCKFLFSITQIYFPHCDSHSRATNKYKDVLLMPRDLI